MIEKYNLGLYKPYKTSGCMISWKYTNNCCLNLPSFNIPAKYTNRIRKPDLAAVKSNHI